MTIRFGILDIPGSEPHKKHTQSIPLAGGIVIVIIAIVSITIFRFWKSPYTAILIAAAIIFIFGMLDDIKKLGYVTKLLFQILAVIVMISANVQVRIFETSAIQIYSPMVVDILDWLITIFWMVGITNSINLIDSMDGLAVGLARNAFAFFIIMSLIAHQTSLALFSTVFLGICLGLSFFNSIPARLFLGDSGAQTLGYILAAIAILYTPLDLPQLTTWFVPIMMLGVPIFDTSLVVVSRLRRHQNIFRAELNHIYHRLISIGYTPRKALQVINSSSLLLGLLAFITLSMVPWQANLIFGLFVCLGIALIIIVERKGSLTT